jgi:hypothetical protein
MTEQAPLVTKVRADSDGAAAGADSSVDVRAPFAGTVSAVNYVPRTVLTGANTDSRTITVTNKGQDGSGSTVVASKAFVSGVNAPADDETAITLSVVANAPTVAEGDILECASTHVGSTGLADPGGTIIVEFTRA